MRVTFIDEVRPYRNGPIIKVDRYIATCISECKSEEDKSYFRYCGDDDVWEGEGERNKVVTRTVYRNS